MPDLVRTLKANILWKSSHFRLPLKANRHHVNESFSLTLQMEVEQARLQNDLQRQSDNYNKILTRRDREHQDEDNLATMLRSDVERLAAER